MADPISVATILFAPAKTPSSDIWSSASSFTELYNIHNPTDGVPGWVTECEPIGVASVNEVCNVETFDRYKCGPDQPPTVDTTINPAPVSIVGSTITPVKASRRVVDDTCLASTAPTEWKQQSIANSVKRLAAGVAADAIMTGLGQTHEGVLAAATDLNSADTPTDILGLQHAVLSSGVSSPVVVASPSMQGRYPSIVTDPQFTKFLVHTENGQQTGVEQVLICDGVYASWEWDPSTPASLDDQTVQYNKRYIDHRFVVAAGIVGCNVYRVYVSTRSKHVCGEQVTP